MATMGTACQFPAIAQLLPSRSLATFLVILTLAQLRLSKADDMGKKGH